MRILTSFVTGAALLMTAGLGCAPDPDDVFTSLTTTLSTTNNTVGDGDGDTTGDGDGDTTGDGDGDTNGDGDGDGDGDTNGDGDGDGDCPAGTFNCPCDNGMCDEGLTCDEGVCSLGGGDGDGDGDPGGECTSYDPMMCPPPGMGIMVGGIDGSFCTCACTTDADCLAGPPGTQGGCILQTPDMTTYCGLLCSVEMDACPAGSTCKSAGQMDPDIGLCTFP
jgi:hypothetical protein